MRTGRLQINYPSTHHFVCNNAPRAHKGQIDIWMDAERRVNAFPSTSFVVKLKTPRDINIREKPVVHNACLTMAVNKIERANYHALHRIFLFCFLYWHAAPAPPPSRLMLIVRVDQCAHASSVFFVHNTYARRQLCAIMIFIFSTQVRLYAYACAGYFKCINHLQLIVQKVVK
jgi:hypothetical protein